jgi:hypothetical protein
MPILRHVALVVQDDQALRDSANEERRRSNHGHPAEDGYPALDETPERRWAEAFWCVERGPAVLSADGGIDGGDLGNRGCDGEVAEPAEDCAVDEGGLYRSVIVIEGRSDV